MATGTSGSHQRVRPTDALGVSLLLPPLSEQRAIAHILGALDDKIEVNRRMNETLEEMARSLFKSWFVDFDPVHAKAALNHRAPSHHSPLEGESARQGPWPAAAPVGGLSRLYSLRTLQRAKALRQNRTDAEGLLWHFLRNRQLDGYKFRRQQPIGPYIADFACLSEKLLIELDGGHHAQRSSHDTKRDRYLQDRGYKVLRVWNNDVFGNCFGVLERIHAALTVVPPPHQPSPDGSASATPPQGGSDGSKWSVERARDYLNRMDPKIANLFPDTLDDEGKPVGWRVGKLSSSFRLTMGQSPPGSTYNDDRKGLPFFQGRTDFGFRYPENRKYCTAPTRIAERDDTLVSVRAPVGDINMAWEKCCIGRGVAALRHMSGSRAFTYYSAWAIQQTLRQYEHTGTVFGAINKRQFETLSVVEPPPEIVSRFDCKVGPFDEYIRRNVAESRTLAQTRDTLLPKLISGEIRVAEAKKAVEAVT